MATSLKRALDDEFDDHKTKRRAVDDIPVDRHETATVPSLKRELNEESDERETKRRAVGLTPSTAPPLKRELDDRPDEHVAKRQAVGNIAKKSAKIPSLKRKLDDGFDDHGTKRRIIEEIETELTPTILAKRNDAFEREWYPPSADVNSEILKYRAIFMSIVNRLETWEDCLPLLNDAAVSYSKLAVLINDLPEELRLEALDRVRENGSEAYSAVIDNITLLQADENPWDPGSLFPRVATDEFLRSLPASARRCLLCDGEFKEGRDIIMKNCGRHSMHHECLRSSERNVLFQICDCVRELFFY